MGTRAPAGRGGLGSEQAGELTGFSDVEV
jgi:hypothetical protein